MTLSTTTRLTTQPCPGCGRVIDAVSTLDEDRAPAPGDFSVCIGCAAMLVFTDALALRLMTPDEFVELDPENAAEIGRLRSAVAQVTPPIPK